MSEARNKCESAGKIFDEIVVDASGKEPRQSGGCSKTQSQSREVKAIDDGVREEIEAEIRAQIAKTLPPEYQEAVLKGRCKDRD